MVPQDPAETDPDLLEQYTFYAETANQVSNRRLRTNQFYVSLLSGILVVLPIVLDLDNLTPLRLVAMCTIGFVGVAISVLWFFNILSYRQLNGGKYEVIHEMERNLPYACFEREWEVLSEGEDPSKYLTHWKVERMVPWIIALPYFGLVVFSLSQLLL